MAKHLPLELGEITDIWEGGDSQTLSYIKLTLTVYDKAILQILNSYFEKENKVNNIDKTIGQFSEYTDEVDVIEVFLNDLLTTREWTLKQFIDFLDNVRLECELTTTIMDRSSITTWGISSLQDFVVFDRDIFEKVKRILKQGYEVSIESEKIMSVIKQELQHEENGDIDPIGLVPNLIDSNFDTQGNWKPYQEEIKNKNKKTL